MDFIIRFPPLLFGKVAPISVMMHQGGDLFQDFELRSVPTRNGAPDTDMRPSLKTYLFRFPSKAPGPYDPGENTWELEFPSMHRIVSESHVCPSQQGYENRSSSQTPVCVRPPFRCVSGIRSQEDMPGVCDPDQWRHTALLL